MKRLSALIMMCMFGAITSAEAFAQDDLDCDDFATQAQAQAALTPGDPNNLDADNDGIACETSGLPAGGGGDDETASPTPTSSPTADAIPTGTAAAAQYQYKKTVTALPSTGGPGPSSGALALGAGALLVAGGLVARRIVR